MPAVHFVDINRKVECVPGTLLRDVAIRDGYDVYDGIHKLINCRGEGLCGSCKVAITEGRSMPRNETEDKKLSDHPEPWRLACQVQVLDNITVTKDADRVAAFTAAKAEKDARILEEAGKQAAVS